MDPLPEPELEPEPGLGSGDLILAASYSAGVCGLLLGVFMNQEDPTRTHARLHHLSEWLGRGPDGHALVGLVMGNLFVGLCVVFLAVRTRSIKLDERAAQDRATARRVQLVTVVAGLLALWGVGSWLAVMAGS